MDIGAGTGYPSSLLSNFAPHEFEFRGVKCAGMEGLLQSFKFKSPEIQMEVCKLIGIKAKSKGKNEKWYEDQTLYWQGAAIKRDSKEYQVMLDEAYNSLAQNNSFRGALLATDNAVLTHATGKSMISETILTESEFCGRLTKLREKIKTGEI